MNDRLERNRKLVEKYPFLLIRYNLYTGRALPEEDIDCEYTWFDEIPEGWAKAFGEQMCEELLEILKEADYVDKYQITQIKEKFGLLRIYDGGVPKAIYDKYKKWLIKYERISERTCIKCGSPATHMTRGWIMPVCSFCDEIEDDDE